jgi:hypothetical protein
VIVAWCLQAVTAAPGEKQGVGVTHCWVGRGVCVQLLAASARCGSIVGTQPLLPTNHEVLCVSRHLLPAAVRYPYNLTRVVRAGHINTSDCWVRRGGTP